MIQMYVRMIEQRRITNKKADDNKAMNVVMEE